MAQKQKDIRETKVNYALSVFPDKKEQLNGLFDSLRNIDVKDESIVKALETFDFDGQKYTQIFVSGIRSEVGSGKLQVLYDAVIYNGLPWTIDDREIETEAVSVACCAAATLIVTPHEAFENVGELIDYTTGKLEGIGMHIGIPYYDGDLKLRACTVYGNLRKPSDEQDNKDRTDR